MITVSAPGKTILHGEHSVVYGKAAIAVSVNLRTKVSLTPIENSGKVALLLDDVKFYMQWDIDDVFKVTSSGAEEEQDGIIPVTEENLQRIRDLLDNTKVEPAQPSFQAALTYLYLYSSMTRKYAYRKNANICATVASELPIGAGLGSSASYSVCLSAALLGLCKQLDSRQQLTESDLELINKWAFQAERILHGKPSGIDNTTCTYGGALLFQTGKVQKVLRNLPALKILLVNTRVPRNTKHLVAQVKSKHEKYPAVMNLILQAMEEIALHQWGCLEQLLDSSAREAEKPESFRDLVILNHHLLNSLGVGHPKLEIIFDVAERFGLAAKLTGAGGGGCAIIFLKDSDNPTVGEIKKKLTSEGFHVWEVGLGCPGIILH